MVEARISPAADAYGAILRPRYRSHRFWHISLLLAAMPRFHLKHQSMECRAAFGCACRGHKVLELQSPNTIVTACGKLVNFRDISNASSTFLHIHEQNVLSCSAVCLTSTGKYIAVQQKIHASAGVRQTSADDVSLQQVCE